MPSARSSAPLVRALSVHAGYACAHSGACCRAGWTVPVDPLERQAIAACLARGQLAAPGGHAAFVPFDADDPSRRAFGHDEAGACVFLARDGSSLCTIHRDAGEARLPVTCRQFPRMAVVGDGWTDVTLSHFCPTAAARLVDWTAPLSIVTDPACCRGRALEGLDTRGHLPPLLRPGVLQTPDSWRLIESAAVGCLDAPRPLARRLATLDAWLDAIEAWTPRVGPLDAYVAAVVAHDAAGAGAARAGRSRTRSSAARVIGDWRLAWRSVPRARAARPDIAHVNDAAIACARSDLAARDDAVGRYLATKVVASWVPWMATRASTIARFLHLASHVVIVEAARRDGPLDRDALVAVIREADGLLVHLAEVAGLVAALEAGPRVRDRPALTRAAPAD